MRAPRSPIDTPAKMQQAREYLGMDKAAFGRAMRLGEKAGRETVRRWEAEGTAIPGPVQIAAEAMVRERSAAK